MYRSLEPNAEVTHDDHIYDDRAKITRQIDVSIKYKFAGMDHLIIVQAKDYKIKANVAVVDQFQTVIADTKANKGILICSKGFSESALTKAKSYGIECLTVHSALNKKWEKTLNVPVRKIVHEFSIKSDVWFKVKAGTLKIIENTYSYDGVNVIGLQNVIHDHIIDKMGWEYIKKTKNLRVDLKRLSLYHAFDLEMLPVIDGFIEISYLKSSVQNFHIVPEGYLYSTDQIRETNQLHDLTITAEMLESLAVKDFENDKEVKDKPQIIVTVFKFISGNATLGSVNYYFGLDMGIEGEIFIKGKTIMFDDDRTRAIVDLQNKINRKSN